LRPDGSALILDGDWGFPLRQTSEEPCEMYVYEVKGFPELVKIGIAKESKKDSRNTMEIYYGKKVSTCALPVWLNICFCIQHNIERTIHHHDEMLETFFMIQHYLF
jgi:hypothetical protein